MTLSMKNPRAKPRWLVLVAVVAVASLTVGAVALANHVGSSSGVFESADGNLVVDHENSTAVDWGSFTDPDLADQWNFTRLNDDKTVLPNGQLRDDQYSGGTKQDDACPNTTNGSFGGPDGSKVDLDRLYLANKNISGDEYLFLSWVRVPQNSQTASSHVAYEFNKGTLGACANSDLLQRVEGDMLIVYDFPGGDSEQVQLKLSRWLTSAGGWTASDCEVAKALPCWGDTQLLTASDADGRVNTTSIGPVTDPLNNDQQLGVVEFGEAGINLTAAEVFSAEDCESFGWVTGVSRSSGSSGSAQMKDKVGPAPFEIGNCGSVVVHKTDADTEELVGGATFTITPASNIDSQGDVIDEDLVTVMEEIADGIFCTDELFAGDYVVTEATPPDQYAPADPASQSVAVAADGTTCADADERDADLTFENEPLTHRVIVIVCHEADGMLAPSEYWLSADDEDTLTSIDSAAAEAFDEDLEAFLCGLDGFGGLLHGEEELTVDVGSDAHE